MRNSGKYIVRLIREQEMYHRRTSPVFFFIDLVGNKVLGRMNKKISKILVKRMKMKLMENYS